MRGSAAASFATALLCSCASPRTVPRARAPVGLHDTYASARNDQYPEGAAFDEVSGAFFLGSLARGDVSRITNDGDESIFYPGPPAPGRSTLGMAVDAAARRLWVCVLADATSKAGSVWVLDIDDGTLLRELDLATAVEGASCNDIALDAAGVAYVTDRERAAIYRIAMDGDPVVWASHALLAPRLVGLNGIAITADGGTMLVTHYKPARLLRIRMREPGDVAEVELHGDAFAGGHIVSGADGIHLLGPRLYVAFDRRIMEVTSHDDWRSATVESARAPQRRGVTAIVVARGALYAADGQTARFLLGLRPTLPFQLAVFDPARFDEPRRAKRSGRPATRRRP